MRSAIVISTVLAVLVACMPCPAQEEEQETSPAPLLMASGDGPKIEFQVGVDAFGGVGGTEFIGGVNATLVYPVIDLLWVGIRPALHYLLVEDSPYDETWTHADALVQVNFLNEPVRLYGLAAGGYSFALDNDFYEGLAHGWNVQGGLGVAWQPEDSSVGLFLELDFRYASATRESTRLVFTDEGEPIYIEDSLSWQTESYDRHFELIAFTINIGLTISP